MIGRNVVRYVLAIATLALLLSNSAQASEDETMLMKQMSELRNLIEMQQNQLDSQLKEIQNLKNQLDQNTKAIVAKDENAEDADSSKMLTSSLPKVNLSLYGHVNKAALFADNGDDSSWYFVDNDNSDTRLGLRAAVEKFENWSIGGRIEYGIVSNASDDVNQLNDSNATSSNFQLRWAEVSVEHDTFGKVSLGKGDSASNNSAEVDLSGTDVAAYSSISDTAGAMLWYDNATATLTDLEVGDVFSNFDGLSRTDRLRYDSPTFAGFSLALSASSGDAYDAAIVYNRKFGETKVAAALAAANPGTDTVDMIYSGSASILFPIGINATVSAATQDLDMSDREDPVNWYAKLGYIAKFTESSTTAFSADYGETTDLDADGDTGKTFAVAAVHNLPDWGTQLYLVYRLHQLDRSNADYEDINVVMTGARVKF
ncbi:porin [Desulfopila sp. IMCC35008]|uniref:porin n=1 Tax=Desulfopila sp. IMCC35008 TaxID=2653858 RepID=UPI0013D4B004|nr:hypothetical protein [Desulfopila sp. IMCC35008]